jgi:hypothetical protein
MSENLGSKELSTFEQDKIHQRLLHIFWNAEYIPQRFQMMGGIELSSYCLTRNLLIMIQTNKKKSNESYLH